MAIEQKQNPALRAAMMEALAKKMDRDLKLKGLGYDEKKIQKEHGGELK